MLLVAVHQRPGKRRDVGGGAPLAEPLRLLELLVQLSAGGVLEDQVHAVLIVEISVEPQDVWMPEVGLDLDLASQLVLHVRLLQLLLEKNLEGDDVLALLLAGQVNVAEFAATQGLAYIEVAQLPSLLLLLFGLTGARWRRRGARGGGVLLAGIARTRCTRGLHDGRRLLERVTRFGHSGGHSGAIRVPLVCCQHALIPGSVHVGRSDVSGAYA
mmetsp:Transcript_13393/g.56646  ORF Transcript_13393/g.56646 Transcript_13393/m.56646 type:complete len:214 (+) Transcript_13393:624-1265(+)